MTPDTATTDTDDDLVPEGLEFVKPAVDAAGHAGAKQIERLIEWESAHRKPGVVGDFVKGFGPGGVMSLCLPSAKAELVWRFKDGEPIRELADGALSDEKIREMRDRIIRSLNHVGYGRFQVSDDLLRYGVALVFKAYQNVVDSDLEMIFRDNKWVSPLVIHAAGGQGFIDSMKGAAHAAHATIPLPDPPATERPPSAPVHDGIFGRMSRWLRRR